MGSIAGFCLGLFLSTWFLVIHQSIHVFFTWCLCLKKAEEEAARILSTFVQNWHNVTSAILYGQKVEVQPRSKMEGNKLCLLIEGQYPRTGMGGTVNGYFC